MSSFVHRIKVYFQAWRKNNQGVVATETALIWGVIGVGALASGYAFYNHFLDAAIDTAQHNSRRTGLNGLEQTALRNRVANPLSSSESLTIAQYGGSTNGGTTYVPDPATPWVWASTFADSETIYVDGVRRGNVNYTSTVETSLAADFTQKCMGGAAPGGDPLQNYVGNDFTQAESSGCAFNRVIPFFNSAGETVPVFTPTIPGDPSDAFYGVHFADELEQWGAQQASNCPSIADAGARTNSDNSINPAEYTNILEACKVRSTDPVRNPNCYDSSHNLKPSLCGAAPVVNARGEIVMWRAAFMSEPVSWRETQDFSEHTQGRVGNNYVRYASSTPADIPMLRSTLVNLTNPTGANWSVETAIGTYMTLPMPNPGCPASQRILDPLTGQEMWSTACNPSSQSISRYQAISITPQV